MNLSFAIFGARGLTWVYRLHGGFKHWLRTSEDDILLNEKFLLSLYQSFTLLDAKGPSGDNVRDFVLRKEKVSLSGQTFRKANTSRSAK